MDLDVFLKCSTQGPTPDYQIRGKCGLDSTFLARTKRVLSTFKLRVTGEDDVEPLKDNKHNSEMIDTGFTRVFLDVECTNCL